jgi:hypothetical protein
MMNSRIAKYSTPTGYRGLTFDNASRITQIGNYLGTSTTASGTQSFTYDNAGRLLSFNGYINNGNNVANITLMLVIFNSSLRENTLNCPPLLVFVFSFVPFISLTAPAADRAISHW